MRIVVQYLSKHESSEVSIGVRCVIDSRRIALIGMKTLKRDGRAKRIMKLGTEASIARGASGWRAK